MDNDTVRKAYTDFAQAWFQHRISISDDDRHVKSAGDVFQMPASIVGARTLVCGGYARMGAVLMKTAGADKISFTVADRATDERIREHKNRGGHIVAKVTRHGESFYITNDLTADNETAAMNVTWHFPDEPYVKADGNTYEAATQKLGEIFERKRHP